MTTDWTKLLVKICDYLSRVQLRCTLIPIRSSEGGQDTRYWRDTVWSEIASRINPFILVILVLIGITGMTEAQIITSNPLEGERKVGSVGHPLPSTEIRVADADGNPVDRRSIGMVEIRGKNVFKGYWNKPEKTAEEFRSDGFFISGDLAYQDDDGYLFIVGRDKDLVISGGLNVYPKEVEGEIDDIPEVLESAVIGVPHPEWGEAVVAVIVPNEQCNLSEEDVSTLYLDQLERSLHYGMCYFLFVSYPLQIIGNIRKSLASYKVPKKIAFIDELPRNAMGKVQKNQLRDTYRNLFE